MTTWKAEIEREMFEHGETLADVESNTLTDAEMMVEFDDGYGLTEGKPFTVWTTKRVYFPVCHDGAESVKSVSRHPDGRPTGHLGGG